MKIMNYGLSVTVSIALCSAVFAWAEKEYQMSGTVVTRSPGWMTIEDNRKQTVEFHAELGNQRYQPKVGDKVTVSYISQRDRRGSWFAVRVEKAGNTEKNAEKLDQADAKSLAKDVATPPNIQATQNEESVNENEVTPESIAEALVQAYSGTDVDAVASLYADRVDHTDSGVISNATLRAQAKEYFARWPVRQWSLVGPVKTTSLGATRQKIVFSASYDVSDPQTNKRASGIAKETLILAADPSGAVKIVSQKEQTSKRSSRQSDESGKKTSANPTLEAAKAEYEASSHDEAARSRYVAKLADIYHQLLQNSWATGEKRALEGSHFVFEELAKHPAPATSDSKKLSQHLVGEWAAPRHGNPYEFRADGKWGRSGSQLDDNWRIQGNRYFARDATGKIAETGTIILLNDDYFIYSDHKHYVTFYVRFQKALDAKRKQEQAAPAVDQ